MLSSNDVAAMMGAQAGQFAGVNQYAQSIGIMTPQMSLGGYGPGQGSGMRPMGMPGMHGPPPAYSYQYGGMTGPGYGGGNQFAGHVMAGLGGGAALAGVGASIASMYGPLKGVGHLMDPIAGFMRSGPAIPFLNPAGTGTLMSGLAGAIPGALVAGTAAAAVGSFVHGGQQQAGINSQLGGFGFMNPASRSGTGFTRQDATDIGSSIRSMAHIPEMLTSVEELTRMLPKLRQAGVMTGVKDAAEFTRRFKETVTTIRDMSKMLGTTMEEAATFFQHSKSMGITGTQGQLKNTFGVQFTAGYTGMTNGQVMQMQQGGASIARSFGARGKWGASGVTNIAQRIQSGLESGQIEDGLLEDVSGGLSGSAATQAASEKMFGMMMNMSQTAPGRALMAGAMKNVGGKWQLDEDIISKVNRGEMSVDQLKSRGMGLSDEAKVAFSGPQGRNLSAQFAGQVDFGRFMKGVLQGKTKGAAEMMIHQYSGGQASQADIEMMMNMGQGPGQNERDDYAQTQSREMSIRDRTDPSAIWKRLKTRAYGNTFGHVADLGAKAYQSIGKAYDSFIDDLVGRHIITLSKEGAKAFERAMGGGNNSELKQMFEQASQISGQSSGGGGFRKLIAGGVGLAVGLAAAPIATPMGGAFLGGMAAGAVDNALSPDSDFMNWARSTSSSSGRTATGRANFAMEQFGIQRTGNLEKDAAALQAYNRSMASGETFTGHGIAAGDALFSLQGRAASKKGYLGGEADKKLELLSEQLEYDLSSALISESGASDEVTISTMTAAARAAVKSGDYEAVAKAMGMSMPDLLAKLDQGGEKSKDMAKLLRAGQSSQQKAGRSMGMAAALVAASPQVAGDMYIEPAGVGSGDLLAKFANIETMKKHVQEAESELSSAFGENGDAAAIVRTNKTVRDVMNDFKNSKNKDEIRNAINSGNPELLRKLGINLSGADLDAAKTVMKAYTQSGNQTEILNAIGKMSVTRSAEDITAIKVKMKGAGTDVLSAAANAGLTGDAKNQVNAFGEALEGFGSATSEDFQAKIGAIKKTGAALVDRYMSGDKSFMEGLSPAARAAIERAAGQSEKLVVDKTYSSEQLKELGYNDAEIARMAPSGDLTVTKGLKEDLVGAAVAGRMGAPGGVSAGSSEEQMLGAMKSMQKNSELQTTLLAALVSKQWGGTDMVNNILAKARGGRQPAAGSDPVSNTYETATAPPA